MHNQVRAQLTGRNRVLYCLLEKQLQMLLTRGGHQASHTALLTHPFPVPTLAQPASLAIIHYGSGRLPDLLSAAPTPGTMMSLTPDASPTFSFS